MGWNGNGYSTGRSSTAVENHMREREIFPCLNKHLDEPEPYQISLVGGGEGEHKMGMIVFFINILGPVRSSLLLLLLLL